MPKIKDILGQRFGSLVAIRFVELRNYPCNPKHRKAFWEFQCDCGKVKVIGSGEVVAGKVVTCGCRGLEDWQSNFNLLYRQIEYSAKRRGLSWELTKEQVLFITKQNCFYCDKEPSSVHRDPKYRGQYVYNGIDRVDNTRGYTIDNVVPCCEGCNRKKLTDGVDDFRDWVVRVYNHWANQ